MLVAIADREVQRILLELLNQMDGFDQNVNVKVNNLIVYVVLVFTNTHTIRISRSHTVRSKVVPVSNSNHTVW